MTSDAGTDLANPISASKWDRDIATAIAAWATEAWGGIRTTEHRYVRVTLERKCDASHEQVLSMSIDRESPDMGREVLRRRIFLGMIGREKPSKEVLLLVLHDGPRRRVVGERSIEVGEPIMIPAHRHFEALCRELTAKNQHLLSHMLGMFDGSTEVIEACAATLKSGTASRSDADAPSQPDQLQQVVALFTESGLAKAFARAMGVVPPEHPSPRRGGIEVPGQAPQDDVADEVLEEEEDEEPEIFDAWAIAGLKWPRDDR